MTPSLHTRRHANHSHVEFAVIFVTILLGLLGGALEVLIFDWLNTSNYAWNGNAFYGNGAFIVPSAAFAAFVIIACGLAWIWWRKYDTWWAVPSAVCLFALAIVTGGWTVALAF